MNRGYIQAISDKKYDLVVELIQHGADADRNELRSIPELRADPVVRRYLAKEEPVDVDIDGQDCRTVSRDHK